MHSRRCDPRATCSPSKRSGCTPRSSRRTAVMLIHVSNQYLDLKPVVGGACIARAGWRTGEPVARRRPSCARASLQPPGSPWHRGRPTWRASGPRGLEPAGRVAQNLDGRLLQSGRRPASLTPPGPVRQSTAGSREASPSRSASDCAPIGWILSFGVCGHLAIRLSRGRRRTRTEFVPLSGGAPLCVAGGPTRGVARTPPPPL
jgi:hypothetical protein